jgi:ribokinase
MRVAVVGHVEWVEFAHVERVPAPGEVVHALDTFAEPAGGGAVAAAQAARLAGAATLFTALGDDELGERSRERLTALGVTVRAAVRAAPTRRALTFLDATGERTITTLNARLVPERSDPLGWEELADFDAVYFTSGDAAALRAARAARVLVASPRGRGAFVDGGEPLDALVLSAGDTLERGWAAELDPPPRLTVMTAGAGGGTWTDGEGSAGGWQATPVPGPVADSYGCGDAFAAALTFALGRGDRLEPALELAAGCGAECLARRGPYGDTPAFHQTSSGA